MTRPGSSRAAWSAWWLFLVGVVGYGYFHQGGGWNQNARFALVRGMVEEHRVHVDSFLAYDRPDPARPEGLVRLPIQQGVLERRGERYVLTWLKPDGQQVPIADDARPARRIPLSHVAVSSDLAYRGGHFHPNKPPGTSFLAVPAYALLWAVERATGVDPEAWSTLTVNAWLTSFLSVGLLSAAGLVLFHAVARQLAGARAALLATLAFGLGTLYWPYATMLYDHNIVAVALLGGYACLLTIARGEAADRQRTRLTLLAAGAGLCAGAAVLTNYVAALAAGLLGLYLLATTWRGRDWRLWAAFAAGASVPLALLLAYNQACFGELFTISNRYQNPTFVSEGPKLFGMVGAPSLSVLAALTFSPFRGLFLGSPVLLLGVWGLALLFRDRRWRMDALLFVAIAASFFLVNCSFNVWWGNWASGPRYLIPALPFLALPLARVLERGRRWHLAPLVLSVAINGLATVVDPQSPLADSAHVNRPDRPRWRQSPLLDYHWPLFLEGRASPVVRSLRAAAADPGALALLELLGGRVSVSPVGVYEGGYFRLYPPGSVPARFNSFNLGELLWPGSRWSILPLGVLLALLTGLLFANAPAPPPPR